MAELQQWQDDLEAQHGSGGKFLGNMKKPENVPKNSSKSVVGTPSDVEVAHSMWVVQLKGEHKKCNPNVDNLAIHIVNENVDPDMHSYQKQKRKDKVTLVEKGMTSLKGQ